MRNVELDQLRLALGRALEHRGRLGLAERVYMRAGYQENAQLAFAVGNVRYRQGRFDEAIPDLEIAARTGVRADVASDRMATALERTGDRERSIEVLAERVSESSDLSTRLRLAGVLERSGRREEAHGHYLVALELGAEDEGAQGVERTMPTDAPLWQTVATLDRVRHLHLNDANWRYRYACRLFELERHTESAAEFDGAYALEQRAWWAYRSGLAWELSGERGLAAERYVQAMRQDKKLGSSKWGLGVFHEEAKHWDLAARAYERDSDAATEVWRRAGLAFRAAGCYEAINNLDDAIRLYRRAVDLRPLDPGWTFALGVAYELAGLRADAIASYQRVILIGDKTYAPRGHFRRGYLLHREGRHEEALDALKAWQDIEPVQPDCDGHSEYDSPAAGFRPIVGGSGDGRTYRDRASFAAMAGQPKVVAASARRAVLQKRPIEPAMAQKYSTALEELGDIAGACRALIELENFPCPVPRLIEAPARGSYAERLALYSEWRQFAPIQDDLIVYESNLGLSIDCNPLAICREILNRHPGEYIHLWSVDGEVPLPADLAESDDVVIVAKDSDAMVHALATAKYLVNNSTFPTYFTRRHEQTYMMTWHGTPLKTLAKDMPEPLVHANMARNYVQATHAIFPNEHTRSVLIEGTDVRDITRAKIEITGYPRNDSLQNPTANEERVALFAPTWREQDELEEQVRSLLDVSQRLEAAGYKAKLRAHAYVERAARVLDPSLEFVPRHIPTNDLLPTVDLLVTDFSSIYFDFAITGRPIIFFVPDWDRYASRRGAYFGKSHLPGYVAETLEELACALVAPTVDPDARRAFLQEFAPMDDGLASARASDMLLHDEHFVRSLAEPHRHEGVLIRQSLIPNGMSTSFINLASQLNTRGTSLTILTDAQAVRDEPGRQETLARVPKEARVVGRVGAQPKTRLESHATRVCARLGTARVPLLEPLIDDSFSREAHRVLGNVGFSAAIEFDGYSEFMARLVAAVGAASTNSAIYMHNDISAEIDLRLPELAGVVRLAPKFGAVIAVSEGLRDLNRDRLGARFGIPTDNFRFARNTLLPDDIRRSGESPLPVNVVDFVEGSDLVVAHAGRFSREKNHDFILSLARSVVAQRPGARFVLMGDGPRLQEVRAKVAAQGLESHVLLLGRTANPFPVIARADCFILPSLHEGQPMVILEARTLGTPVIASDIPSVLAMGSGEGADVTLPLDVEAWTSAVVNSDRLDRGSFDAGRYVAETIEEFGSASGVAVTPPMRTGAAR